MEEEGEGENIPGEAGNEGCKDGWMDGWMDGRAGLDTQY